MPSEGEPTIDESRIDLAARVIDGLAVRDDLAKLISEIDVSNLQNAVVMLENDPALLQTLQAGREIRQRAVQAGLDYQLALADLERAMGTALR